MTEKEVEEVLGGPGKKPSIPELLTVTADVPETYRFWIGRRGFIEIEFANAGHVTRISTGFSQPNRISSTASAIGLGGKKQDPFSSVRVPPELPPALPPELSGLVVARD